MTRTDPAHEAAEEALRSLERRIASEYGTALDGVRGQMAGFLARFERQDRAYRRRVENGHATEAQYRAWRRDQVMDSDRFRALVRKLSEDLTRVAGSAMGIVNGELPRLYAEGMNYGTFEVERGTTVETAFTLYDRSTVTALLRDEPDLYPAAEVNESKQRRWDRRRITSVVTQGLLTGAPMDRIADSMERVVGMDAAQAARAARTCVTAAENSGRVDSYRRAERLGIRVRKQWLATLDGRTRSSHRALDGESVEVEEAFSNGLMYPGDPSGPGAERYNCRCTLVADLEEFPAEQVNRASKLGDMSYDEWRAEHLQRTIPTTPASPATTVVDGSNVIGQWTRRRSEYQFEIEDVLNYQGFDGDPRVVDADEFERAVGAANGGRGFIAQRSYTGPTKEVADEYRRMLYSGKWYVDCSTGGAQYGQGMYCAADYTGKLTDGIKAEMDHYTNLGKRRNPGVQWYSFSDDRKMSEIRKAMDRLGVSDEDRDSIMYAFYDSVWSDKVSVWSDLYQEIGRDEIYKRIVAGYDVSDKYKGFRREVGYLLDLKERPVTYVETMTLDPSAKVISYRDLLDLINDEPLPPHPGDWDIPGDAGAFAAAKGYDAINAEGHGDSGSYTVVLNRTKLIIKRPEGWE